jgi:hypothetical protein
VYPHSFRATFVTGLLEEGAPLHEVQQIIGHTYLASTLAYSRHYLTVREIDERLNRPYRKKPPKELPQELPPGEPPQKLPPKKPKATKPKKAQAV